MTRPLSLAALPELAGVVETPAYARSDLAPGILHVGVGNFHRAHMARYVHDLLQAGRDHDWAIVGAGVRSADAAMRADLAAQDWLSTVVELDPAGDHAVVTGAMVDFVAVAAGNAPLVARMAEADIRIVSLTVTEGGYYIDPATGCFDANNPHTRADAADPDHPATVFGAIVAALRRRRAAGTHPFTVMSCDNLPENGHVARATVLGLARAHDAELADWIAAQVAFPCAMVDRITPATSERERAMVRARYGIEDARPVAAESFRQWVLEDNFPAGRPAFEAAGVTLTPDVTPYETMKIRILNGGHAAIAYPAALLGIHYVHDAIAHPLVRAFLDRLEHDEIIPVVPPVPDTNLQAYYATVRARLENPGVGDTVPRLCLDGSNRQPKFILPSTRDRLAAGAGIEGLALVSALWCRYLAGTDEAGHAIAIEDAAADRLHAHALRARERPAAFLEMRDIFGDLAEAPAFIALFARHLAALWSDGVEPVLSAYATRT